MRISNPLTKNPAIRSALERIGTKGLALGFAAVVSVGSLMGYTLTGTSNASSLSLCGNQGTPPPIQHVVVVMLENLSYKKVIGNTTAAPYQNSLSSQCGTATTMFGASHDSASNYLALSAGKYPAGSVNGCGSVPTCRDSSDNLYHQMDTAGLSWRNYQESMPSACAQSSKSPLYKIGHNASLFYSDIPLAECQAKDLPVADLTAQSGVFWDDLQNQTLPSFSWVTPNLNNDGSGGETPADTWTQKFLATVQQSNSYQAGNTAIFITYDEGNASDAVPGEDCTNMALDLPVTNNTSAHQDSCHIPFFVVYPYTTAGAKDNTFFDHYSVTKTIQDLFGLQPYLAHAGDPQTTSLIGHFGLQLGTPPPPPPVDTMPPSMPGNLRATATSSQITLNWDASTDDVGVAGYTVTRGDGSVVAPTTTATTVSDSGLSANTPYTYNVVAYDAAGHISPQATIQIPTQPASLATACTPTPVGNIEYSTNLSLESNLTGWTGTYNTASAASTRLQVSGGSYDGSWALRVAPKAGSSGTAGVNNASPYWMTSSTAGRTYMGGALVKAGTSGQLLSLTVRETTQAGTTVSSHTTNLPAITDTDWHTISSSYIAKNSGDNIRYSLYATNFTGSSDYFLADCLSLQGVTGN